MNAFTILTKHSEAWTEIGMKNMLLSNVDDGVFKIVPNLPKGDIPELMKAILMELAKSSFLGKIEGFLTARVLGNGPKIFLPTSEQMFALEAMQLNILPEDFNTPFPDIVVDLPVEYAATKGTVEGTPRFSIFHHDKAKKLFIHSVAHNDTAMKSWWVAGDGELEEWFNHDWSDYDPRSRQSLVATDHERLVEEQIRRAVMNYCLLLDEVGVKCNGPVHEGEYQKLVKWCQKKTVHTKTNRIRLRQQAFTYRPAKATELVRYVNAPSELDGEPTGKKMPPHHRRGHYRMQPCKEGRKRIRIPAVFVNAHLLTGELPKATYKS